jgi:hypothetical protein
MVQAVIRKNSGFIAIVMMMLAAIPLAAQITRPGKPYPIYHDGLRYPDVIELQVPKEEMQLRTEGPTMLKPARSGMLIDVNYSTENAGNWHSLSDGTRVWRAAFRVTGSNLVRIICHPFQVNPGVKIYLYDPSQQNILGAFSDLNNKNNNVLATSHVPGEILIIEIHVPHYQPSVGLFSIKQIGCDFAVTDKTTELKDGWFGLSGACNEDINCYTGESYQKVKNAVVRIVYDGIERCTGTLLNNSRLDGRTYVLTAEHCINTEEEANTAVFYFGYESPYCHGPDGSNQKSVSGATLRATGGDLDFSLLELLEPVSFNYRPYFVGWDITTTIPALSYTIHHPLGDVKKISLENDPVTVTSYPDEYLPNTHWRVSRWETGTTEAGSSGGGLFDLYNRVRGTLTGGEASCENSINDYFQMLSHCWDDYSMPANQLAYWLDPLQSGTTRLEGLDPYSNFWESGDTLTNIRQDESLVFDNSWFGWGEWSGHNSRNITLFSEKYTGIGNKKIMGLILHVADNYVATATSKLVLKVWQGGSVPGNLLYAKEITLSGLAGNAMNFIEFDTVVSVMDSFFAGYELFYDHPADTFSTFMAENRVDQKLNTAYIYDNQWYALDFYTGGQLYSSFSVFPVVFDSIPVNEPWNDPGDIIAYPNPARSGLWVEFRDMLASPVTVKLYNMQGHLVFENEYGSYQQLLQLDITGLDSGIYLLSTRRGDVVSNVKVAVIK